MRGARNLAPHPLGHRQRVVGAVLLLVGMTLLVGTLGLSKSMLKQTDDLRNKVAITQGIVDANVRTLGQVQRELLRLDALLRSEGSSRSALRLQEALVSQRVQEGSLSYQRQTLGTDAQLARSRALAQKWDTTVRPLVRASFGSGRTAQQTRRSALARIEVMEKAYNQLVSDGEINRKTRAGEANRETRIMVDRAERLVGGLAVTFVSVVVLLLLGIVVYVRLHRQREAAGAELREANRELQRYAHVVHSTDNMVVVTDRNGLVTWVNPAFERTTGYTLGDLQGRTPGSLLQGPGTDPATIKAMSDALREGCSYTAELVNYSREGQEYWLSLDISPMRDSHDQLTGFVAVETDITERRRAGELLRLAKESAEESAREKASFLASMSHEIRTPLNAVLGLTDLLLLTDLDAAQREYVHTAHSSGQLLLALVNDILDFSALEDGRIETESRAFRLERMLTDTIGMFRADAARRGVALRLELDAAVPSLVCGDETRLRQVLVNLLANGLKFTERGEVSLGVGVLDTDGHGSVIRFAVTDTGIGIPEDRRPRLFQPFSQVDASTTRKYGGTGLGLAICRLLAERMNGQIDVVSEVGRGSTFFLDLDLPAMEVVGGEDLADAVADVDEEAAPWTHDQDSGALRVLLAEDDRVNQMVAVHMLRRLGIEPVVVNDGKAAVEAVCAEEFDLVLMDVHMPVMDGVQATAAIRASLSAGRVPRIAAITANALEGDRERLLTSGMDDYLSKPVGLDDLRTLLRRSATELRSPVAQESAARADDRLVIDQEAFVTTSGLPAGGLLDELVAAVVAEARDLLHQVSVEGGVEPDAALSLVGAASACAALPLTESAQELVSAASQRSEPEELVRCLALVEARLEDVEAWLTARSQVRAAVHT